MARIFAVTHSANELMSLKGTGFHVISGAFTNEQNAETLEKTLNSAGWASLYTDYRNQVSQGKLTSVSAKVETSPLTNRLFKDSENVAKQRRKLMKVTLIPDPDDAPELTPEIARRSQISVGGKVVREATGTMTKDKTS
jgi:hypothetical protein